MDIMMHVLKETDKGGQIIYDTTNDETQHQEISPHYLKALSKMLISWELL